MKVEKNKMVSLVYELRESDPEGTIIETLDERKPLKFIFGSGRLLPDFELNIHSMVAGDDFGFLLPSENAYGERREEMIIDLPVATFERDGKIDEEICRIGNSVPMVDSEGNQLAGVINEITDTIVKMDFNHPMAGVNLYFTGKIIEVREATDSEIMALTSSCSSCGSHGNDSDCAGSCSH